MLRRCLEDQSRVDLESLLPLGKAVLIQTGAATLPILGLLCVIAAIAHVMQFGLLWNVGALQPRFDRLNPIKGFGKLFSKQGMVKTTIHSGKLIVVTAVGYLYLRGCAQKIIAMPMLTAGGAWMLIGKLALDLAMWLFLIMLAMGAIDFMLQRRRHTQSLRMTKQEVKEERRNMDGDPKVKGQRMRLAREITRQRIGAAVPKATVIVTNPTHFSIAIQYDQETMKAPKVIAKGADEIAFTIRHLAKAHGVPIVERAPLARALYRHVNVGQEVRPEFYEAVAEVLAYVYRLEREAKARNTPTPVALAA